MRAGSLIIFRVCKQKRRQAHNTSAPPTISQVEDISDSEDCIFTIERVGAVCHNRQDQLFVPLRLTYNGRGKIITCQLDTGATCNVMSYTDLCGVQQSNNPSMKPTTTRLKFYNNNTIRALGECTLHCQYKKSSYHIHFNIISGTQKPLLSARTCQAMGLITVNTINHIKDLEDPLIKQYEDVFQGMGCLPGDYHIDVNPTVPPVQHLPRRVPLPLKDRLKEKIEELEHKGVIKQVNEPTPWISSMVTVVSPGKLRICIDPRDLNKAIQRPKYQMPTLEEVLPKLANAKLFSVLDAKDGFHQVKLDEQSSYLTTFWTPFGRYRYLRMPFGISSGPEEYQRRMHEIVKGLPGVEVIADDILVYGCGASQAEYTQDHDNNLRKLLDRARETNLKLNRKKLKLRLTEVRYMGHMLTNEGLRADPMKIKAIVDMPRPQDKKAVERLLGTVQYLSRFLPKLSDVSKPLRQLTEKEVIFTWQQQQEEAFTSIKHLVTTSPVLKYYNVKEEVTLQCDASDTGIGAALLQAGQPVAYASRALTKTEQQYAQIEKECMAIVYASEKFDQYILGREVIKVETDHKPLIPIFKKPLLHAPKRLQRMLLRLQKYPLSVSYLPGKQIYIADMLSRAYLPDTNQTDVFRELETINQAQHIRMMETTFQQLKQASHEDQTLQTLMDTVLKGWPENKGDTPVNIHSYWPYRDEISAQDGVLYRGSQVIIPHNMRAAMLQKVHSSHQGANACIRRAKDVLFWPGLKAEIQNMVSQCEMCNCFLAKQQKEPMMTPEIPSRPWQIVAQDLFSLNNQNFLVTVDYYSDFWELDKLSNTSSATIIDHTKAHFARYGIPDKVISDNGPQFRSQEYATFAKTWHFIHITSSPYHSQSNGKAEAAVKIAKSLLRKEDGDTFLAMLNWRNTPTEASEYSPSQKLHSRRTRTLLPTKAALLTPAVARNVEDEIRQRRQTAKFWYDRTAKSLPELQIGQGVRMQPVEHSGQWKQATIVKKVGERSYLAQTEEGNVYRRNRKFLKATAEEKVELPNPIVARNVESPDSSIQTPVIDADPTTTISQQSSMLSDHRTSAPTPSNKTMDPTSDETESNRQPSLESQVTKTRSGRNIRPPS